MTLLGLLFDPSLQGVLLAGGAALAGLTSSLHCFAMCGPLACVGCARTETSGGRERLVAMASYQGARVVSYIVVGAVLGALGGGAMTAINLRPPAWIPWAAALLLAASALGLAERIPAIPGVSRLVRLGSRASASLASPLRSGAIGALTPLLPCGLLVALYTSALVTGSAGRGALLAGGFALGSLPALVLAQLQTHWLGRLPRGSAFVLRRVVPLAAAAMLVWRAMATGETGDCCSH